MNINTIPTQFKYRKVMLINPPKPPPGTTALHYGDLRPPLGLGYIAAVLEKEGIEVHIADNYVRPRDMEKEIKDFKPDLIGMYMNSPGYYVGCDLIDLIKEITNAPLIVGGPQASLMPETIPAKVDHVVLGEGEYVMLDICKGVAFPRVITNNVSGRIKHLDEVPFPNYKHFINEDYNWRLDLYHAKEYPVFTMHTSRSCPFRCSFCGVSSIWTRQYTFFSAERIVAEIDFLVERYGCKGIYFREDLFTANFTRVRKMCELLLQRPYKIVWACESRADITNYQLLELMKKAGCTGLYLGVEAGSDTALKKKKKDLDLATMRKFFGFTNALGIPTYATFCMGTPGETEEEMAQTDLFVKEVKPTSYDKFAYLGLPKSQDYSTLIATKDYYHIDSAGIVYSETWADLAQRLYHPNDARLYFIKQQKEFLRNSRGVLTESELASFRFPGINVQTSKVVSSTANEYRAY